MYPVCVFSGRVVHFGIKYREKKFISTFYNFFILFYDFVMINNKYVSPVYVVYLPVIEQ